MFNVYKFEVSVKDEKAKEDLNKSSRLHDKKISNICYLNNHRAERLNVKEV